MSLLILSDIANRAEISKRAGLSFPVFFDLDSTLFDVSPRISKILHSFAELPDIRKNYPKESELLKTVEPSSKDWGVKRTLGRYGFAPPNDDFVKKLVNYWKEQFFSGNFLHMDQPYEGVREFIAQLHKAGADIHYLSGRDVPRMRAGSIESLKHHDFPLRDDYSNLFLKPSVAMADHEFKVEFFKQDKRVAGKPLIFFENEPAIIHPVLQACPHIEIVFVDTVHSESAPPVPPHVKRIIAYR